MTKTTLPQPPPRSDQCVGRLQLCEAAERDEVAREEAQQRAAEMEGVFAAISASILVFNSELRVTRANPAAELLLGFAPAGLDCETIAARLHLRNLDGTPLDPDTLPSHRALAGHSASGQYVANKKSGERFIVDAFAEPLRIYGKVTGSVILWRDVTERERLIEELARSNAALAEADQRKNEFLGVVSHELRNPLAPLRNTIYVLDHVPRDGPEAMSAKEIIQRQTGHLTRIVDDLLDVTRISRGKIELDRKRIDLRDVVLRTAKTTARCSTKATSSCATTCLPARSGSMRMQRASRRWWGICSRTR